MELTIEEANQIMKKNEGYLDLSGTNITKLPDNLTVNESLNLERTNIAELPNNLTVGRYLLLKESKITELPDNLTVGYSLDLEGTKITKLSNNLTVGGYLFFSGAKIAELPDNLTVGCSLDLEGIKITKLPNNLIVGGSLFLCGTKITELPNDLTVGEVFSLRGIVITELQKSKVTVLKNGDYVEGSYLYCDNMLTLIKKRKRLFNKYDYFVGKIKNRNVIFDGEYYAHCKSIKNGINELKFKHMKNRGFEQYEGVKLSDVFSLDEAKTMYRVLTGACQVGTELFVDGLGKSLKDKYSVQEMIDVTSGQYESDVFREFFGK